MADEPKYDPKLLDQLSTMKFFIHGEYRTLDDFHELYRVLAKNGIRSIAKLDAILTAYWQTSVTLASPDEPDEPDIGALCENCGVGIEKGNVHEQVFNPEAQRHQTLCDECRMGL